MELRITRPAFVNAHGSRGVDLSQATPPGDAHLRLRPVPCGVLLPGRQQGADLPLEQGLSTIDDIEAHYDEYGFTDWTHAETGAPMIKIQHPEFEMWTTGIHARSGVACADCHMPYMREGGVKVSDHWLRSPLDNLNNACQTCHNIPEEELDDRVLTIQNTTAGLLRTQRGGHRWRRSTPSSRRRRPAPPTSSWPKRASCTARAIAALGLRLVGEQHRLPQPAGSGARAGELD